MAGRINAADVKALKGQVDLLDVVASYTQLKPAGRSFKGLCPLPGHDEKTPSFNVTPQMQRFHCFGCDRGGDVYEFLQLVEGLAFNDAVEMLARLAGYQLTYEHLSARQRRALGERTELVELNEAALALYRRWLAEPRGEVARGYLAERGFGVDEVERFELGWAPDDWDTLSRALQADGAGQAELERGGLAVRGQRGMRDRFRGRLLFPIRSASGELVGFGGRVVPGVDYGDFDPPKYLNTAETPLYRKTEVLYALHLARAAMARANSVLVCEGYTDVMALHQAGFENAVATCGTATGPAHLKVLARHVDTVVLAFDGDEAGAKAAERAWEAARAHDLDVRVLTLPDGLDPAELVRERGVAAIQEAVEQAVGVVPFLVRRRLAANDLTTETGRTQALKEALVLLGDVPDGDLRRAYARTEVADALGLSWNMLVASATRAGVQLDREQGVAGVLRRPRAERGVIARATPERNALEKEVLGVVLRDPHLLPDDWFEVELDDFTHEKARAIFALLDAAGGAGVELDAVLADAPDDATRTLVSGVALHEPGKAQDADHVRVLVQRLLLPRARREYEATKAALVEGGIEADELTELVRRARDQQERVRVLSGGR